MRQFPGPDFINSLPVHRLQGGVAAAGTLFAVLLQPASPRQAYTREDTEQMENKKGYSPSCKPLILMESVSLTSSSILLRPLPAGSG
jgi:hypothetical protein